jgi:hypothetical protein
MNKYNIFADLLCFEIKNRTLICAHIGLYIERQTQYAFLAPVYIIIPNRITKSRQVNGVHDVFYKMFFMTN